MRMETARLTAGPAPMDAIMPPSTITWPRSITSRAFIAAPRSGPPSAGGVQVTMRAFSMAMEPAMASTVP